MQEIYLHLHGYILHVTKTLIYRTFKTLQGKWRQKGRELRSRGQGQMNPQSAAARNVSASPQIAPTSATPPGLNGSPGAPAPRYGHVARRPRSGRLRAPG